MALPAPSLLALLVAAALVPAAHAGIGYSVLQLWTCGSTPDLAPFQAWDFLSGRIGLHGSTLWGTESQVTPVGSGVAVNATLWAPPGKGVSWNASAGGPTTIEAGGLCWSVLGLAAPGAQLWLQTCNAADSAQLFQYAAPPSRLLTHVASGLCVDGGSKHMGCQSGSQGLAFPYCNASLSFDDRVADLVGRLTLEEKANLMDTSSGGAAELGLPPIQVWNEGLHGIADNVGTAFVAPTPYATSFPQVILTASAFNVSLWEAIGAAISTEARAFANAGHAGLTYWAPNINMFRDPRWGRGQETPGEDFLVSGRYATAYARGMQEGSDPRYLKTSIDCKHFAGYSLELWNGTDRHHFNAVIDDTDLVEFYLPAFQACVADGRGSSMMCSYNAVNGVPSCANSFLMTTVSRGEWGFDGYITSDCGAVTDVQENHRYTNSTTATAAATLGAGMDIGCDSYLSAPGVISDAVAAGALSEVTLDAAVGRMLRVRMRLGEFDDAAGQPYTAIPPSVICSTAHTDLSRDAARQAITLLYNPRGALPVSRAGTASIAVVGPVANASIVNGGPNYAGVPCGGAAVTILAAFQSATPAFDVSYAPGCANVACASNAGFAAAAAAASAADLTVVVVGIDQTVEDEGLDRINITLPGLQNDLAVATCRAAKGPCVIVLMSGGSQDLSAVLAEPKVSGAFNAGFPGGNGAEALVELVFGDAAPAGRLTQTFYPADFIGAVSLFDMGVRPGPSPWPPGSNPGRTYRWYTGTPIFPFGWGLSYTTWSVTPADGPTLVSLAPTAAYLAANQRFSGAFAPLASPLAASYTVNVTNTGAVDSPFVVLGFLVPPGNGTGGVPLQELFGFERVFVPAGQTVTVFLGVQARDLTAVVPLTSEEERALPSRVPGEVRARRVAMPGEYVVRIGVRAEGQAWSESRFTAVE